MKRFFNPFGWMFFVTQCFALIANAQEYRQSVNIRELEIVIPPLETVIDSALAHNASVRFRKLDIAVKSADLTSEKNYWMRNMGVQADTRYGTFDNFSSNNNGQSTTIFNTTSQQFNYGMGLYIKFPIVDMINRRNQIKRAETEVEKAKMLANQQEQELRQYIIKLYYDLVMKQRVLNIQALALGNARANLDMVETGFRNGTVPVVEYVRISDIASRVEADFERAKSEFITAKLILEDFTGMTFKNKY